MEPNHQKATNLLQTILVWAVSILLVLGVVAILFFARHQKEQKRIAGLLAEEGQQMAAKAAMTEEELETLFQSFRPTEPVEESLSVNLTPTDIDFVSLKELNKDVYAYIRVEGTDIAYPILQHPLDDTYYLNYNIDGSYGYPGCIYTELANAKDFSDPNTVIYGHNMKNGTMFSALHKFEKADFFADHDTIYIDTEEGCRTYKIFAAYVYDDRHLLNSFDFKNKQVYQTYLDSIFQMRDLNANIREDVEITTEDKIITLATCMGQQPTKRLLVQAVLQ